MEPRGIRNNNPGNIVDLPGNAWAGRVGNDGRFVVFDNATHGIRALTIIIKNKYRRGLHTIDAIISDYAPPTENLTGAYVDHVAKAAGMAPDRVLSYDELRAKMGAIVNAIIMHENGKNPYKPGTVVSAVAMGLA